MNITSDVYYVLRITVFGRYLSIEAARADRHSTCEIRLSWSNTHSIKFPCVQSTPELLLNQLATGKADFQLVVRLRCSADDYHVQNPANELCLLPELLQQVFWCEVILQWESGKNFKHLARYVCGYVQVKVVTHLIQVGPHLIWSAFSGIDRCPIIVMPLHKCVSSNFVDIVHECRFTCIYFFTWWIRESYTHDALVYHSKYTKTAHCIKKLKWPTNLPNLKPIENLWMIVKDFVQNGLLPQNQEELIKFL